MNIRSATRNDDPEIWKILEPTIRAGETYPLPREMTRLEALAYWHGPEHGVFVAEESGNILGTYYMKANNRGGGAHVLEALQRELDRVVLQRERVGVLALHLAQHLRIRMWAGNAE